MVQHHVASGDFSRWIQTVVRDEQLALAFSAIEDAAKDASDPTRGTVDDWRRGLLRAIEERYRRSTTSVAAVPMYVMLRRPTPDDRPEQARRG